MSTCRSCGAPIIWAVAPTSGKRIPIDAQPAEDGNVQLREQNGGFLASVLPAGHRGDPGRPRYKSHFATCPHADTHRKAH